MRTGVFRKDNGTVPGVHERRLFGHEVHPVHRGVHEQNVELLVRRDRSREVVRDLELDRQPGELLKAIVDATRLALDGAEVLGVLRDVLARRIEKREHADPPPQLWVRLQQKLECAKPADDVLRRIRPVDANDELVGTTRDDLRLGGENLLALRQPLELVAVNGDRRRQRVRRNVADDVPHGIEEVLSPPLGVERDDVVREHAVVNRVADVLWEHVPVVRLRPRHMCEVHERRVRHCVPDEPRCEIEVIVVEEDGRVRLIVELLEDCSRKTRVDGDVPLVPGRVKSGVDCGRVRELPEVVLDEPQHGIRDDVVKAVVRLTLVADEAQAEPGALACRLIECLACERSVLVRDRTRDPRHVVQRQEPAQCRGKAAACAARDALAVGTARVRHRAAVRNDDQLPTHARSLRTPLRRPRPPLRRCRFRAVG